MTINVQHSASLVTARQTIVESGPRLLRGATSATPCSTRTARATAHGTADTPLEVLGRSKMLPISLMQASRPSTSIIHIHASFHLIESTLLTCSLLQVDVISLRAPFHGDVIGTTKEPTETAPLHHLPACQAEETGCADYQGDGQDSGSSLQTY